MGGGPEATAGVSLLGRGIDGESGMRRRPHTVCSLRMERLARQGRGVGRRMELHAIRPRYRVCTETRERERRQGSIYSWAEAVCESPTKKKKCPHWPGQALQMAGVLTRETEISSFATEKKHTCVGRFSTHLMSDIDAERALSTTTRRDGPNARNAEAPGQRSSIARIS